MYPLLRIKQQLCLEQWQKPWTIYSMTQNEIPSLNRAFVMRTSSEEAAVSSESPSTTTKYLLSYPQMLVETRTQADVYLRSQTVQSNNRFSSHSKPSASSMGKKRSAGLQTISGAFWFLDSSSLSHSKEEDLLLSRSVQDVTLVTIKHMTRFQLVTGGESICYTFLH